MAVKTKERWGAVSKPSPVKEGIEQQRKNGLFQSLSAVWVSWLQACPSSVAPAGGTAAPLRLRGLTATHPHHWTQAQCWPGLSWVLLVPQIHTAIPLPSLGHGAAAGGHREPWRKEEKKKKVYFIREPLKAPGFC